MKTFVQNQSFFLKKFIQTLNREEIPLEIIDTSGNRYRPDQQDIRYRLHIRDPRFFSALASPNAFSLGEAYVKGYFDISGSIRELYETACERLLSTRQKKTISSFFARLWVSAGKREKDNISYHYDVPSPFYRVFLGRTMGYTCGYYTSQAATMDDAQNEKMDIICRKLHLKTGEHLLDIGCGWGNFAIFAARHYGVDVTGITLSREQKAYAEEWIKKEGLDRKITVRLMNYRDLGGDQFDKISCIGMSEHVGRSNMPGFFKTVYQALKTGGLFMQHTITTNIRHRRHRENSFLNTYMFPGGELMQEHDLLKQAADCGFELLNAENFRPHYIRTLNDWISRMETHRSQLREMVSDQIFRIYHVFFIGSQVAFGRKQISLFQNLFYKTGRNAGSIDHFLSPYSRNETRIA